jgi:hypothetical protein
VTSPSDAADALVRAGVEACSARERPDLVERLQQAAERLRDPATRVVVAGEFKQG